MKSLDHAYSRRRSLTVMPLANGNIQALCGTRKSSPIEKIFYEHTSSIIWNNFISRQIELFTKKCYNLMHPNGYVHGLLDYFCSWIIDEIGTIKIINNHSIHTERTQVKSVSMVIFTRS